MEESSQGDLVRAIETVGQLADSLDGESTRYWQLHRKRFVWIAETVERLSRGRSGYRALDVGNSFQTVLVREFLSHVELDTIGFFDYRYTAGESSVHYDFDLNDAYDKELWPALKSEPYDLIVFAEVIEHLHTSPAQVLAFLKSLLAPQGRILLQTPNAAALKKRLKLLRGRNPYELIRLDRANPGHFRELTLSDLKRYAKGGGFEVESVRMDSDLVDGKRFDRFCDRLSRYLPPSLRGGISILLRAK